MRQATGRRPALLTLVYGVFLVLVGVTASALVMVTSAHLSSSTLAAVVSRDGSLLESWVNRTLAPADLALLSDPSGARRADVLEADLASLTGEAGILRIDVRSADGRILLSSEPGIRGESGLVTHAATAASRGRPSAGLITSDLDVESAALGTGSVVREYLPLLAEDGTPSAVIALWRDGEPIVARLDAARRDVMLVTLAAALLLAVVLFAVFRAAQARISRQQVLLREAERRDALTGLLNHGAVVSLLTDLVEDARSGDRPLGVALIDIDNFRLTNETHGHDAGDEVLLGVAGVIAECVQPGAVPQHAGAWHVARYGPDELLVVGADAELSALEAIAAAARASLTQVALRFGDSEALPVTVSVGICMLDDEVDSVTELLSGAAVALGEATAGGGDRVAVFARREDSDAMSASFDVLRGLVIAVDTKDRYTKRHSEDVARYATFLARRMGVDEEMVRTVQRAGLLHDIGKIGIPDALLRKPSKLTAEEFAVFQQHVVLGDAIVRELPDIDQVRKGVRHHHERWDGRGYVDGLEGEEIPLIGRILAVADAFSAMTTTRPYRKALPLREALMRLEDAAGTQLQDELVAEFVRGIETAADAPLPGERPRAIGKGELWVA